MNRDKTNRLSKSSFLRKFFIVSFAVILLSSYVPFNQDTPIEAAADDSTSDLDGHWAEEVLNRWVAAGNIQGYNEGTFGPDRLITRGELAALINRSFSFAEKEELAFTDLASTDWAYGDLSKAVQAGYLKGYGDGTIRAKNPVSRQEAATIVARLLGIEGDKEDNAAEAFTDSSTIAKWSKAAVGELFQRKIITGYVDGSFKPLSSITRAEAVVILDRALVAKSPDVHYDQAGVYGSMDQSQSITGSVYVSVSGVTLKNMAIEGDLILEAGIGEGDVFLEKVTVRGQTIIRGGGENSIHVKDSRLNKVDVDNKQGTVRIVITGSTEASDVTIRSSAIIVVASGTVHALKILESATGTKLTIEEQGTIVQLRLDSVAAVRGKGKIEEAILGSKAEGSTFETAPFKLVRGSSGLSSGNIGGGQGEEPGPEGNISGVSATNGTITVQLKEYPAIDPVAADFTIRQTVNGQAAAVIVPSAITGSAITKQVVLSVPDLPYEAIEQQLVYSVTYHNGLAVEAESLTIAPGLPITSGDDALAVIVAPDQNDDAKARAAAWKLSKYVKKATGIELNILTYGAEIPDQLLPIYVGVASPENQAHIDELLLEVDRDGFVIDSGSDSVTIMGPTGWGTEFGVDEFLEAYVGVRWLLPGVDGEFVPEVSNLTIPKKTEVQTPSFFARTFGSADTREAWAEDNRIYRQIYLNHSMFELFAPSKYMEDHPDWYPGDLPNLIGGWQPCYSNPATAAEAIKVINQYFTDNPQAVSYSIAVNDGGGYCEGNPSHPAYTGEINSIGMLNMSDVYFKWVQTVAEGVNEQHQGKYLSTIAYHETYDPPSVASGIQLPANVLVYITDERMSWADPEMASLGKDLTERWKLVAPGASFYEYLYGGPYVLPRSYFHQMADNYQYAYETGVQAQTTELAPNFGEGPKSWLAAKLQWDVTADVDVLLHDWYVHAVGADAAPYVAQYYAYWENFWQNRVFETDWYNAWKTASPRSNFMSFSDASYLKIVDASEMAQSRQWLELAVAHAGQTGTASQLVRAQKLLKAFEYYESSVLTYPGNLTGAGAITNENDGIALLDEIVSRLALSETRKELVEAFKSDNILALEWSPEAYGMMWSGIKSSDVQALIEWIKTEAPTGGVRSRMDTIIQTEASAYAVHYVKLMLAVADQGATLNTNTSFEEGTGKDSDDWWYWLEYGQTSDVNIHRSNEYP
ncbi:MAG: hypothetical protein K0Q81_797, partial [Paenibacillus sp.]|nr:hypothetical protein [Paenibacillus sp.]